VNRLREAALNVFVAAQLAGAIGFVWISSQGFSLFSAHFFLNTALPWLLGAGCLVALVTRRAAFASLAVATLWISAAISAVDLFPDSVPRLSLVTAPFAIALALLSWRGAGSGRRRAVAVGLGILFGVSVVALQRAPEASTHPLGGEVGPSEAGESVDLSCGGLPLRIEPGLRFGSCTTDRFWALGPDSLCAQPEARAMQVSNQDNVTRIKAQTRLAQPVFSHLNAFTRVRIGRAGLWASLAGSSRLNFTEEDRDEPSTFAWLGAGPVLHLSRGTKNEKGPFLELETHPLASGALVLDLGDVAGPACRLVFETWAAQASVEESPTAGWGVAQNAVAFFQSSSSGVAEVVVSLAATSIGRGWDSVGHAAGTYRNVLTVEPLR
jgi:hypothetical protein